MRWSIFLLLCIMGACTSGPSGPGETGRIVLQVDYEKPSAKAARALVVERMALTIRRGGEAVINQDLKKSGNLWRGEVEVAGGSYEVQLDVYMDGQVQWHGVDSVVVSAGEQSQLRLNVQRLYLLRLSDTAIDFGELSDRRIVQLSNAGTAAYIHGVARALTDRPPHLILVRPYLIYIDRLKKLLL